MTALIAATVPNIAVSVGSLPVITWRQARVVTTELLARLYRVDEKNVQNNYLRNADRFVEGKHYFKLEAEELREFKKSLTLSKMVSEAGRVAESYTVSRSARSLILWTEQGAARHAKMLETDEAWDVFEQMEDFYFRAREAVVESPEERMRLRHATVSIHKAMNDMLVRRRARDGKECAAHHFMIEAKLINHVLLGAFKGADRDSLSLEQLDMLAKLEAQNMMLIAEGMSYADRKIQLEQMANELAAAAPASKRIGGVQ
jgi:hypothetical protein